MIQNQDVSVQPSPFGSESNLMIPLDDLFFYQKIRDGVDIGLIKLKEDNGFILKKDPNH